MPSRRDRHIVLLAIFYFWSDFRNLYIARHHLLIKNSESCLSVRPSVVTLLTKTQVTL